MVQVQMSLYNCINYHTHVYYNGSFYMYFCVSYIIGSNLNMYMYNLNVLIFNMYHLYILK